MLTFNEFITESIRQGLPHITTMSHEQFGNLVNHGQVHLHGMTEKTDGQSFKFGHDEHGFYTQSTGSGNEKMRTPEDYHKRVKARAEATGKEADYTAAKAFGHVHSILHANKALQDHLHSEYKKRGEEVAVKGESFYKPWGKPSEHHGEVKFVGTSYDPSHMGKVGKIVIHSKLPENQGHDIEHFKKHLSNEHINFDDDKLHHEKHSVDVSDEKHAFGSLNHELLKSRTTPKNKEAKLAELDKMSKIQASVSNKVDGAVKKMGLSPKWGHGSEGVVVHPIEKNPAAPRFKVTSDTFRAYRASDESKQLKKRDN